MGRYAGLLLGAGLLLAVSQLTACTVAYALWTRSVHRGR